MTQFARTTPESEQHSRIAALQEKLVKHRIDGVLILQKADMFYYSGTAQQGWLYIPESGEPLLMVFKAFERARQESGFKQVVSLVSPKKIPQTIAEFGYSIPKIMGLELDVLTANQYLAFQQIFSGSELMDISFQIRLLRAVKSAHEIELMRQASHMADKVAAKVADLICEGITEIGFAGQLEAYARSLGHQGLIRMRMWDNDLFYGHIMSGPGAAVPSCFASPTGGRGVNPSIAQGPGFNTIKKNEPVLVDYVFALNGYLSDHTRIFCLGNLSDDLLRAHDAMLEIQEMVKQAARPGSVTGGLYDKMISMADKKGYKDNFMGAGARKIRFTGHGLGIELDEFPFIAKDQTLMLETGMMIALEPKAVFPGKGVVGIENTFLVTDNGLESLTTFSDKINRL
ncbi:MAG: Xaa-Pro peptidase family protein [Proteobacteria bacterium]|nr:Xaa-Pro peptidase family protein [Pseudomonadota bacterium]MBU1586031.1 Xaa-Pro peptidase family protein [Pseudomonadota bacterium]MBU2455111.1 Xaa-Pro peptidase family protein [Pseudomonadota bacterium]MBU2628510.1 Xaa-Pro peptidase family protein [Pseudomonadota bacterium]